MLLNGIPQNNLQEFLVQEENKDKAIKLTSDAYKDLDIKDVYETFDFAEFLKNNEKFEKSIFLLQHCFKFY